MADARNRDNRVTVEYTDSNVRLLRHIQQELSLRDGNATLRNVINRFTTTYLPRFAEDLGINGIRKITKTKRKTLTTGV